MTYTVDNLAADLSVDPADIRVVTGWLHHTGDQLPAEVCGEVRSILDPHGERTAPAGLYWPGHPSPPAAASGVTFPSPTDWEEDGRWPWEGE